MGRGGKRPGAGRPRQGMTRKVSLTLTEEEWQAIEQSGQPTVAAYLKHVMNEVTSNKNERSDRIQRLEEENRVLTQDNQRLRDNANHYAEELARVKAKEQSRPRGMRKRLMVLESAILHRWKRRKRHWERLSKLPDWKNDLVLRSMEEEIIFLESVIQSLHIKENEGLDSYEVEKTGIQIDPIK